MNKENKKISNKVEIKEKTIPSNIYRISFSVSCGTEEVVVIAQNKEEALKIANGKKMYSDEEAKLRDGELLGTFKEILSGKNKLIEWSGYIE